MATCQHWQIYEVHQDVTLADVDESGKVTLYVSTSNLPRLITSYQAWWKL
jgi:hypothetical protein